MIEQKFECVCGKFGLYISEHRTTNPCPECGRTYKGVYNSKTCTIDAIEVEKVYCKNCSWFKKYKDVDRDIFLGCFYISSKEYYWDENKFTGIKIREYRIKEWSTKLAKVPQEKFVMEKLNKNNNCQYYKKVWWKFWVK